MKNKKANIQKSWIKQLSRQMTKDLSRQVRPEEELSKYERDYEKIRTVDHDMDGDDYPD